MKHVLLLAIMSVAVFAQAQRSNRLESEADAVAIEVRRESPYLSIKQEQEIMEHLRAVRQILRGGGTNHGGGDYGHGHDNGNHGGGYQNDASYTCVARDNDDRAPWVIGVRQGVNVTRIQTAQFSSKPDCDNTIRNGRVLRGNNLICLSRDNDGRAPWLLANIDGTSVTKIPATLVDSLDKCQAFLRDLRPRGANATFCGSRDNDSRAPYQAMNLNVETNEVTRGTEMFDSVAKCNAFLGQ
jgi:hypothetical protein